MLEFACLCSEPRSKAWLRLTWKRSQVQQCSFHTRRWQWTEEGATTRADHGKMLCHPQWQDLGQHPRDLARPTH